MRFNYNDGGRAEAGYKGTAGDCVCRAIAIAAHLPYEEVYKRLANGSAGERKSRGRSARNGIRVKRQWFKDYMRELGFEWTATMRIGSGCTVHLHDGELPMGRLVVSVSGHYTSVIDGVVNDTYNPQREIAMFLPDRGQQLAANQGRNQNGVYTIQRRCVYGYWKFVRPAGEKQS